MKQANTDTFRASTTAGDDGEAVPGSLLLRSENLENQPNLNLEEPSDAGWYVAVVRVNCELRIARSVQKDLNFHHTWFDYWVPQVKVHYVDKRTKKHKVKEKTFLSTFIFCRVSPRYLDEIRFRPDVYKMLTLPGHREFCRISDKEIADYRALVENDMEPVNPVNVPLKKGTKVRVIAGQLKGLEAYVQRFTAKKAVIGNEIKYISGATITVNRNLLEVISEK